MPLRLKLLTLRRRNVEYTKELDQNGFAHLWRTAQRRRSEFLAAWCSQFLRSDESEAAGAPQSKGGRVVYEPDEVTKAA